MAQAGTEEEKLNREEVQMKSSGGDGDTLKRERKPTPWIKDSNNQPTPGKQETKPMMNQYYINTFNGINGTHYYYLIHDIHSLSIYFSSTSQL